MILYNRLFKPGPETSPTLSNYAETGQLIIKLSLLGFNKKPNFFFSGSPKDTVTLRQQLQYLRTQHPHYEMVGWVGFGRSIDYVYLLLFRGLGYKMLLVQARKKVEQRRLYSEFLF